ncbi:LacI family DNA-binding transcriptional regulator [Frondihabitans peucedani]|uniref:LacI family DNA-binding transcriptional regulator n=1 Tax=Frondihabitans peucedani TaxID=598626 RepID=A0ABP8DXZ6_9MICO
MNAEPERHKRATVIDVARAAGVSRQTVTRAMNDMDGISAATRQRVLDVAKELRYRPSRFGRGLVVGHRPALGLVTEGLTNPYFPELADGVVEAATAAGWNVLVTDGSHDGGDPRRFLREVADQVDAVIGYFRIGPDAFDDVFGDLPVVVLEGTAEDGHRGVVEIDFAPGLDAGIEHLLETGRRRIVMIDSRSAAAPSRRTAAFRAAMERHGLDPLVVFEGDSGGDAAGAVARALREAPDVDAFMTFNDLHAFAVLKAVQHAGLEVPDRCAVLGIDGLAMGVVSSPELSSLDLDIAAVGRIAVELAIGMQTGALPSSGPEVHRVVRHTLLLRESA